MSEQNWRQFVQTCASCKKCELWKQRTHVVVWRGAVQAPLLLIGEGPGAEEDKQGLPFVGRSGQLLDTLLTAFGIDETQYHIANIVKCRPPGNRQPSEEEARACKPLLRQQFLYVRPKVIVLLGGVAYRYFTGDETRISQVRGIMQESQGYYVMPTFHRPMFCATLPRRANSGRTSDSTRQLEDRHIVALDFCSQPPEQR